MEKSTTTPAISRRICFEGVNPQDFEQKCTLPLKMQEVYAKVNNSIATIDVTQTYFNNTDNPLEATLKFPIEQDYALGRLTIQIADKIIEGKILTKEKAKERYEDAIAGGNTAVMASEKEDEQDIIELKVGNILQGQEIVVQFQFLHVLRIEIGAYCLKVPVTFFPSYEDSSKDYKYFFKVDIFGDSKISYISCPTDSNIIKHDSDKMITIEKSSEKSLQLNKDLVVYYKTADMEASVLQAQESESHPDEVACMLSFVPSFLEKHPTIDFETAYDEKPEPVEVESFKETNFYIFIVDRSGSMSGSKMETTKQALVLFLKSLPSDSLFDIVSFGSTFEHMSKDMKGIKYDDKNVLKAIQEVNNFSANLGGTEIYEPLQSSIMKMKATNKYSKKIFLLTDGEVSSPEKVIQLAKESADNNLCKIHTFGVGRDCSVKLVSQVARVGKGSCSLVVENSQLKPLVIQALSRSQEPQYDNCQLTFSGDQKFSTNTFGLNLQESFQVFRNDLFICFWLMKKDEFKSFKASMTSDKHKISKKSLQKEWSSSDFTMLQQGEELFKIVARQKINNIQNDSSLRYDHQKEKEITEISLKYQVVSKYTSFIGVNKNDQKPIEELKQVEIVKLKHIEEDADQLMDLMCYSAPLQSSSQHFQTRGSPQSYKMACSSVNMSSKAKKSSGLGIGSAIASGFSKMFGAFKGSSRINDDLRVGAAPSQSSSKKMDMKKSRSKKSKPQPEMMMCRAQEENSWGNEMIEACMDEEEQLEKMCMPSPICYSAPQMIQPQMAIAKPIVKPKTLDELLLGQSSSQGCWNDKELLLSFVQSLDDMNVQNEIKGLLKNQALFETVWLTLVALYVLNNQFSNKEDEWQLISNKAKKYLKSQGIDKPDNYVNKMSLTLL